MQDNSAQTASGNAEGIGCAATTAAINLLAMGAILPLVFITYSNDGQRLWYQILPILFFVFGAFLPALVLWKARKSQNIANATMFWLLCSAFLFFGYAFNSGGGM